MNYRSSLPLVAALLLAGCSYTESLPGPNAEQPLTVYAPEELKADTFRNAVITAFQRKQWVIKSHSDTQVVAKLDHHDLVSTATATLSPENSHIVTIQFDTVNDKGEHRTTPGTWRRNVQSAINENFRR